MRRFATILAIIVILCCTGIIAHAAEFHVRQDGVGDFTVIQEAIDAAVDGDMVIVHPSTYYENVGFNGKNIVLCSTDPDDWAVVEATVIDGGQNGPVVGFAGSEDEACLLSGFTITNGKNGYGGGISGARKWNAPHARATIENCAITGNTAADAIGASGGGLMWFGGEISNCTISKNTGGWGGGLAECYGCRLEDCQIIDNTADGSGGGLFKFEGSIRGCTISDNSAWRDGGGLAACKAKIDGCTIARNTTDYGDGGGLCECTGSIDSSDVSDNHAYGWGGGFYDWKGDITNCRVTGNSGHVGGGIVDCEGDVTNCLVTGNMTGDLGGMDAAGVQGCVGDIRHCTISKNSGSGLYDCHGVIKACTISSNVARVGAGLQDCSGSLEDCVISDNLADMGSGGGICGFEGTIRNCLIVNNVTEGYWGSGGGICVSRGQIENCTIVGNAATDSGGGVDCFSGGITNCIIWGNTAPEGSELTTDWKPQVTYCCIKDWGWGVGNISDDPLFVTGPLGEYYLSCIGAGQTANSPCIDAGSDTSQNLDLDKRTTRTNDGFDKGIVDIGYHYPVYDINIETSLNDDAFSPGQLFEGFLIVENDRSEIMVDVYVGLILPGGVVLCFGPEGARYGIFPYTSGILMQTGFSAGPLTVFSITIPDGTPAGNYTYASVLVGAGEADFTAVSTSPFVIY